MAKRYFLSLLALMFCFSAFSQQSSGLEGQGEAENPYLIQSVEDFNYFRQSGDKNKCYKQTVNLSLGEITITQSGYIQSFSGTYDGDGHNISFTATATAEENGARLGLFGNVTGVIKNLNLLDCAMTATANTNVTANVALLCARLSGANALITDCNIINGTLNSKIKTQSAWENAQTGLLVGYLENTWVKYASVSGTVTGMGYVGGVVGQAKNGDIYGCSFEGEVKATYDGDGGWGDIIGGIIGSGTGGYAGGIVGYADSQSTINLCYVNADIESATEGNGVGSANPGGWFGWGSENPVVKNSYAEGTVDGEPINGSNITNSNQGSNNYHPGSGSADDIVENLNDAADGDDKISFSVVNGEVVFGAVNDEKVCDKPTNLSVTNNNGACVITWEIEDTDTTTEESKWYWTITGGDSYNDSDEATTKRVETQLPPSQTPYTFTVYTDCTEDQTDLLSETNQTTINVACPIPSNLQANNITYESFDFSWNATANCQLIVNGNTYTIEQSNSMSKQITQLAPQTQYPVTVKAKCGEEYIETATAIVTTASLPVPTNLSVSTSWNENSGSATISWTPIPGMTYEVNTDGNAQTSPCEITDLEAGSHTAKVRTVKTIAGTKYYSAWAEMPYTISEIPAPSNPQVNYTQDGNYYDVTISWTAGTTPNDGWQIGGEVVNNPYILQNQTPGYSTSLSIQEIVGGSTSEALVVPIQVPCLPVGEVIVEPTQSTVKFTFENQNPNRVLIIGETEYEAIDQTLTVLVGLTSGKTYSYEVREYCLDDNYASKSGTFETVGCYAVKNLTVSNLGVTSATVSWETQTSLDDLKYRIRLNDGEPIEQTEKQITFTNLSPATNYTVSVEEQCGNDWATATTTVFTTESGSYVTAQTGMFNQSSTWQGGKVPAGNVGTITIQQGHTISLSHTLKLTGNCQIINEGVLKITQQGELINKTENNVGGIVEVVSPIKDMNKWTFIGAPFKTAGGTGYKLECIKPTRSGEDIIDVSVSKYDYLLGDWSDEWETIESSMETGEGYFAWPFYSGTIIYTTYGDLLTTQYDYSKEPATELNNENEIIIAKPVINTSGGYWMALSNPYPAKLSVEEFIQDNQANIQGGVVYTFNGTTWDDLDQGDISHTDGFFVNLKSSAPKSITFNKEQLTNYNQSKKAKKTTEYIELSLQTGGKKSKIRFNHNPQAEQTYDAFDANKMFSPVKMTEPYFVTDGVALSKEEVRELPYTATLNVRSFMDREVKFVADNIPEGYVVFLLDNGQDIRMTNGTEYTTNVTEGENENRFQLLVKKQERIERATSNEIVIKNDNRQVTVQSQITNLNIEVYNSVGQKVFETKDYNFTLTDLPSGAYLVKAFYGRVAQTAKIVIQ